MRNVVIPLLVLLPSLAGIAHANQNTPTKSQQMRALTAREKSASFAGCNEIRRLGLAPIRRGEPGYRPWMDGDNDGLACEPIRRR